MRVKKTLLAVVVIVVVIQLVPVDRSNPPERGDLGAPAEVSAILQRACNDCHSNGTTWPWYSYVAPVSWLVANDVHEGRDELNFSVWSALPAARQQKLRKKIEQEVAEGEMPPWTYLLMHPEAAISDGDKAVLARWSSGAESVGK